MFIVSLTKFSIKVRLILRKNNEGNMAIFIRLGLLSSSLLSFLAFWLADQVVNHRNKQQAS